MLKNWKTTLAGFLASAGIYFSTVPGHQSLGAFLTAGGVLLLGGSAADSNKKQ